MIFMQKIRKTFFFIKKKIKPLKYKWLLKARIIISWHGWLITHVEIKCMTRVAQRLSEGGPLPLGPRLTMTRWEESTRSTHYLKLVGCISFPASLWDQKSLLVYISHVGQVQREREELTKLVWEGSVLRSRWWWQAIRQSSGWVQLRDFWLLWQCG